jgi:hypothetical protein
MAASSPTPITVGLTTELHGRTRVSLRLWKEDRMPFKKGRQKTGGRMEGTANKDTQAIRQMDEELVAEKIAAANCTGANSIRSAIPINLRTRNFDSWKYPSSIIEN